MSKRKVYSYEEHHKEINGVIFKKCVYHDTYFPEEEPWFPMTNKYYYQNEKNKSDGFNPECRKCSVRKSVKWWENNKERYEISRKRYHKTNKYKVWHKRNNEQQKDKRKEWFENNPTKNAEYQNRRKQYKKHDITEREWIECKEFFNYKCCYCGLSEEEHKINFNQQLHKDHAINKGSNTIDNCLPACKSCNTKKRETDWFDWYIEENPLYKKDYYEQICLWISLFE